MEIAPLEDKYENIDKLPRDVIRELLLSMDWQSAIYYCQISKRVHDICQTGIWKDKLSKDFPTYNIRNYSDDVNNYLAARFSYVEDRIKKIEEIFKTLPDVALPILEDFYKKVPPQRLKKLFDIINEERVNGNLPPLTKATSTKTSYFERNSEIYGLPVSEYIGELYSQLRNYIQEREKISAIQYKYLSKNKKGPKTKSINIPTNILNLGAPNYRQEYDFNYDQEIKLKRYLKDNKFSVGDIAVMKIPGVDGELYYLLTPYPSQNKLNKSLPDNFDFYIHELGLTYPDAYRLYDVDYR